MRIKLVFLFLLISSVSSFGQSNIDFATVDAKTYSFYQNAQWDSLIVLGKKAQRQGVDYYYLNYRMAVAYFYKENYKLASHFFQKALDYNSEARNDEFFAELYHLALVYSQRNDLAIDMPLPRNSNVVDPMALNNLVFVVGGGRMINYDHSQAKVRPNPEFSELRYQDAVNYWAIAFKHQFNASFNLGVSYSNLHFLMKTTIVDEGVITNENYKISQYNFAIIPEFSLGRYWQLKPVVTLTSNRGFPYSVVDTTQGIKKYGFWEYSENNLVLGVNAYRDIRKVKLGFNLGVSNYSERRQAQVGANLSYFPFGNLNLYSFTAVSLKVDDKEKSVIFHQKIGFKVFSKLWLEGGGLFGQLKNYNDFNLGYGYNIADYMDMIFYGKFIFVTGNQVNFFVEGQYLHKYTYRKDDFGVNEHIETRINYDQWNIEGGLLWNF